MVVRRERRVNNGYKHIEATGEHTLEFQVPGVCDMQYVPHCTSDCRCCYTGLFTSSMPCLRSTGGPPSALCCCITGVRCAEEARGHAPHPPPGGDAPWSLHAGSARISVRPLPYAKREVTAVFGALPAVCCYAAHHTLQSIM